EGDATEGDATEYADPSPPRTGAAQTLSRGQAGSETRGRGRGRRHPAATLRAGAGLAALGARRRLATLGGGGAGPTGGYGILPRGQAGSETRGRGRGRRHPAATLRAGAGLAALGARRRLATLGGGGAGVTGGSVILPRGRRGLLATGRWRGRGSAGRRGRLVA